MPPACQSGPSGLHSFFGLSLLAGCITPDNAVLEELGTPGVARAIT